MRMVLIRFEKGILFICKCWVSFRQPNLRKRRSHYPFQIPLRAMIPQKIDNLLVAEKAIAVSHIASAAYRVHSYEWSSGAAAGTVAAFALDQKIMPFQLVQEPLVQQKKLQELQLLLNDNDNPTTFPNTSIFNETWDDWK